MSSIDQFNASPFRLPLSSGARRSLDIMQERANELRRLADAAPDRRSDLLGVAQRLEGLAQQADFADFGRLARLSPSSTEHARTTPSGHAAHGDSTDADRNGLIDDAFAPGRTIAIDI
jgi:hypothetical protein